MFVKRGRKNIESSNNVVVRIPQTTTIMIFESFSEGSGENGSGENPRTQIC
jgi:hypothetical protein